MRSRKSNKDRQYNDQRKRYEKTDKTMTKGKGTKRQTTVHKTLLTKLKGNINPTKTGGELRWSGRIGSSCFSSDTRH